jgi:hypothetical protein
VVKVKAHETGSSHAQKNAAIHDVRVDDGASRVNRAVLKAYIERMRKAGTRELHYLKIKNDLNIISRKKGSKLYRILQALVTDGILVRKGSSYVIMG